MYLLSYVSTYLLNFFHSFLPPSPFKVCVPKCSPICSYSLQIRRDFRSTPASLEPSFLLHIHPYSIRYISIPFRSTHIPSDPHIPLQIHSYPSRSASTSSDRSILLQLHSYPFRSAPTPFRPIPTPSDPPLPLQIHSYPFRSIPTPFRPISTPFSIHPYAQISPRLR